MDFHCAIGSTSARLGADDLRTLIALAANVKRG
jgi:hypothetical protein